MTTQYAQGQEEKPQHPFDLPKSDFEELLERDFNVKGIEEAQEEARFAQGLEDHLMRSVWMARAIDRLRVLLTNQLMDLVVMPLMNTRLGFKTDRPNRSNPTPYSREEVRECVVEALIRGAFLVGNEFNIIAKSCYCTKEFFQRKIREFPELTDFVPLPGIPRLCNGGAIVPYTCSWKLNGQAMTITREIPVKVNEQMGSDAIIGKSDRKMWATVFGILTGSQQSVPDGDVGEIETTYAAPGLTPVNTRLTAVLPAIESGNASAPVKTVENPEQPPEQGAGPGLSGNGPPTYAPRGSAGRPGPKKEAKEPPETKRAEPAAPSAPVVQNLTGYAMPLPAGTAPVDWLALSMEDVFKAYDAMGNDVRRTHWSHVTDEVQQRILEACKIHEEKAKQDKAAEAPQTPPKGSDEAQEFVDTKSVDQLKAWFLKMTDDLRRLGREAAGVANLTEATEAQIRVAALAMRMAQLAKK